MKPFLWSTCTFALLAALASPTMADSVQLVTASGTDTGGKTVSATAQFTVSAGNVFLVLTNTTAVTHSAAELLTGLSFTFASGAKVTAETSAVAPDVIELSGGKGGPTVTTDLYEKDLMTLVPAQWQLKTNAINTITWNNGDGPDYGIIGPAPYTGTDSSIVGNGPHNPYINGTAKFNFVGAGIRATDYVTSATFYYGTGFSPAMTVSIGPPLNGSTPPAPLPVAATSGITMMVGLAGVAYLRRRKSSVA